MLILKAIAKIAAIAASVLLFFAALTVGIAAFTLDYPPDLGEIMETCAIYRQYPPTEQPYIAWAKTNCAM